MITGQVNAARQAMVPLAIRATDGPSVQIEAVVDTGFTESLTLLPSLVAALGLHLEGSMRMILADGSTVEMSLYRAIVIWDMQERTIVVHEAEDVSLVGMRLIQGHRLVVEAVDGGRVTIEPI